MRLCFGSVKRDVTRKIDIGQVAVEPFASAVTGITGTSAPLTLKIGSHTFGRTAQMADGTESDPNAFTAALVKPGAPVSFTVSVQ